MPLTIWTNLELDANAKRILINGVQDAGCELIESAASRSENGPDDDLANAHIAFGQPIPQQVMGLAQLRWIALSSAGYTNFDTADCRSALKEYGTILTNSSTVYANPCAEHALAMILATTRQLPLYIDARKFRSWNQYDGRRSARLVSRSTVLLLGFGAIGRRLAALLAPFNCRIIAFCRSPLSMHGIEIVNRLDATVIAQADHIVNVLPESATTRRLCDADFFARVRSGACFYNIGRGATVDQEALSGALRHGIIANAWLDALDPEPLPSDSPLWTDSRCQITPHVAGGHQEEDTSIVNHFLRNLDRFGRGDPLADGVV